ncbi:MAG: universal stress protein [Bacteroidia bacterium]
MMKSILVPTDFSKPASNAMHYALAMAKKEKAEIILAHAFDVNTITPYNTMPMIAEKIGRMELEAEEKLKLLCAELRTSGIQCSYLNKLGDPIEIILSAVREVHADLIIMGTRGASGIKELLVGSNTVHIINRSTCPVLAVPARAVYKGIHKISYAVDYKASDLTAFKKLTALARVFHSEITIVHAAGGEYNKLTEDTALEVFRKKVQKSTGYDKINTLLVFGETPTIAVEKHIQQAMPDLIALSAHHRGVIASLFSSDMSEKLAHHTQIPLLAFHPDREKHSHH